MTFDFKIKDCDGTKFKVWYDHRSCYCPKPEREHWLTVWARFLDSVSRLPESRRMFHISRAVWVAERLGDYYEEDELVQLTKFEKKANIFKIDLEGWL